MFDANEYRGKVESAVTAVRDSSHLQPRVGIILGTGLGMLAEQIDVEVTIDYDDIPHFPISTVDTHHGRLLLGHLDHVPVVAMQGRFHLYEGYSAVQVAFPVRVMAGLGISTLLISNAAGGMNPDMSAPYDPELLQAAETVALARGVRLQRGVYVAVVGPNLETRAEYRFLRSIGADAVGMSTVPEVIVARHMDIRTLAISVITDECFPDALQPISIPEILAAAAEAEPKLTAVLRGIVKTLK
jgi:purine-nucleoside phosphorylase